MKQFLVATAILAGMGVAVVHASDEASDTTTIFDAYQR